MCVSPLESAVVLSEPARLPVGSKLSFVTDVSGPVTRLDRSALGARGP
jgi:hypothetical protein